MLADRGTNQRGVNHLCAEPDNGTGGHHRSLPRARPMLPSRMSERHSENIIKLVSAVSVPRSV